MKRTLILGYGNIDRQDDGVAWHVLNRIALRLGYPVSPSPDEGYQLSGRSPDFLFVLQLTPELAETIAQFERVCFVDAHTGNVPNEVNIAEVKSEYQASPFTHHMTAATCLAMSEALYGHAPEAILVSVRGYEFGFDHHLSQRTEELADQAARWIWTWLDVEQPGE